MLKIQNSQFFRHSVLTPDTARVSLKVKGHLLNILATLKCQMSHSFVQYISLTSWKADSFEKEGDEFPHQTLPLTRGHSAPLTEFFTKKKTHTHKHAPV